MSSSVLRLRCQKCLWDLFFVNGLSAINGQELRDKMPEKELSGTLCRQCSERRQKFRKGN